MSTWPGSSGEPAEQGTQADWLKRDQRRVAQSAYAPPLVFERGRGCELWDVDGRRYLDFESGQFCMSTGHSHPKVTRAISDQAGKLMNIGNRFTNCPRILLAERLAALAPDPLAVSFFCSTGSEANEIALRIAKLVTGRFEVIALALSAWASGLPRVWPGSLRLTGSSEKHGESG